MNNIIRFIFIFAILSSFIFSCNRKDITTQEIAEKCQKYHNPENNWYTSKYVFDQKSKSVFSDNNEELITLTIDNNDDVFIYNNHFRKINIKYSKKGCNSILSDSLCNQYMWTKSFYPYITGMPCKFFDEGTIIEPTVGGDIINENEVYVITINYEKETWDYYINKSTFYLEGFKFVFNNNPEKGELVLNEGQVNINGLIVPKKRRWYDLNKKLLGTDIVLENE